MKPDVKGKKLLVLGAGVVETTLVKRAQHLGIYTIVTDYNLDHTISPAKDIADEYWDINWSDVDSLQERCKETGVDGVIAGYSEFRVESCIKLCERLNLPCYINMEQLEVTREKILFKEACRRNNVPVIKEYASVQDVDSYPVIVKPTDRAGSIGVGIATNYEELLKVYDYAMQMSICKKVIIEQFIHKAVKFDVYYAIIDGEIILISSNDVLNAKANGFERVVQSGWVLPSVHHSKFIEKADPMLRDFIRDMGIRNGYIFFSGFADDDDNFSFFECGFRLCGGHFYEYFPHIGMINNMDLFIYHALTGSADCVLEDVKPGRNLKCVTINLYAKAGTIAKIEGFDRLDEIPECYFKMQHAYEGMVCEDDKAILSKIGMAYFCSESDDVLANAVDRMYQYVKVTDEEGNDMIYDRVDTDTVRNWWRR